MPSNMSPLYSQHDSANLLCYLPSGDSTPYSPPEDINDLASPRPRPSSSPFSVGTTPVKTSRPFTAPINASYHHEPYSPPSDITTMREFDLPTRTENLYLDPSNFAPVHANLQRLKGTFNALIGPTSTSLAPSLWDVDAPPRPEAWPSFLLSLELEHEELQNALFHLAQLIASHTDYRPRLAMKSKRDGMLSGSPLQVFTWEDLAQGDWIERMSGMVLRSGILQGVRRLIELGEGSAERIEGVMYAEDGGDGDEEMTGLEGEGYGPPCRPS